jgi:hypothetical protein
VQESFGYVAFALSVGANIPYIVEILRRQAKPHRISWLIWTCLGGVYFLSTIFDTGATWFTAGELIGPVTIFVLSLFFGSGGRNRFDKYALLIAGTALGLLFIVDGVLISLLLALFVDAVGIMLTIRKIKEDPTSESRAFWAIGVVSACFAIVSLESFSFVALVYPVYVAAVSAYITRVAKPNHTKVKAIRGDK